MPPLGGTEKSCTLVSRGKLSELDPMLLGERMSTVDLLFSTHDDLADDLLRGVINVWEAVFPQRIRGYFLSGSYVDGTPTPTSDLDLAIVFRDDFLNESETEKAQALCSFLEQLHPAIFVDMWYISEQRLQSHDRISVALQLKHSSRLLAGTDTTALDDVVPNEHYIRDSMHIPFYASKYGRPHLQKLIVPLAYPSPRKTYFGYENWTITPRSGKEVPSQDFRLC
jgi:predicted nucleotidyltransferase